MNILIPIVSAILFRLGGAGRSDRFLPFLKPPTPIAAKIWRWIGIGFFIGAIYRDLLPVITYAIATWAFDYGETGWLRRFTGRDKSWIIYGFVFGLASFPALRWMALIQAVIAGLSFYGLMKWSNDGYQKAGRPKYYLDHAYVEIGIGFIGTILYIFKG